MPIPMTTQSSQPGGVHTQPEQHNMNYYDMSMEGDMEVDGEEDGDDADSSNEKGRKKFARPVSASIPKGVRYLKKSDGEPFWRKDIQYDFLDALFENDAKVFTNPFSSCSVEEFDNGPKYTFAELYIRTLAESSKCSKILKERLLKDMDMGKSVAKVCLLVNTGRMNTTINFVPEMRSTLRTYHSIPSLQADSINGGSKSLQDTPRLKSILKAVSDNKEDFKTVDLLLASPSEQKPNTNLVLLLFLLSNNVNGVKFHHLHSGDCHHISNSFMEFFLETKIHPANRAKRFLWLIYTYLETSFTPEELALNPFNPHKIPDIELIGENEVNNFDKDTDFEIEYSEKMYGTRLKYLADEEHNSNPKRGNKSRKEREADDEAEDDLDGDTSKRESIESQGNDKKKKKPSKINNLSSSPLSKGSLGYGDNGTEKNGFDEDHGISRNKNHLRFPLKSLSVIRNLSKDVDEVKPDPILSEASKKVTINKGQQVIHQLKITEKELDNGVQGLKEWLEKYFQYKKSVGNKLTGMQWEEIRYDLVHGIEGYLYQHYGKVVGKIGDKELDDITLSYTPLHDFNSNNEKSQYIYDLLKISKEWIKKRYEQYSLKNDINIDMMKGEINIS